MDKTLKAKWVRALLSGRFEQGSCLLKDYDGKYCCLGVLNEIAALGMPEKVSYLSDTVGKRIGIPHDVQVVLAEANDDGVPFEMLAGLIDSAL